MTQGPQSWCFDCLEGWSGEGRGRGVQEGGESANLRPVHADVWQKPTQCCNYPLILKIEFKTNKQADDL